MSGIAGCPSCVEKEVSYFGLPLAPEPICTQGLECLARKPKPPAPAWQPITDAERDGREVLGMHAEWERPMWCKKTARGWESVEDGSPLAAWETPDPTHFFPLPEFRP